MEHLPAVEKMISKVMKKKDLARNAAIDYMLTVATGRLAALWRYDESLPEGKLTKGILQLAGPRKKRAPKTPKIAPLAAAAAAAAAAEAKSAKKVAPKKRKPAKRKAAKQVKSEQLEIVAAAE